MFKGLSPRAKKIITVLAQEEGHKCGNDQILPEHVIIALLKSGDGIGYLILQRLGVNVLSLQLSLEQALPLHSNNSTFADLPASRRLQTLINIAQIEARSLSQEFVGTEHLLLAAMREERSPCSIFFEANGVSIDSARQTARKIIHEEGILGSAYGENSVKETANTENAANSSAATENTKNTGGVNAGSRPSGAGNAQNGTSCHYGSGSNVDTFNDIFPDKVQNGSARSAVFPQMSAGSNSIGPNGERFAPFGQNQNRSTSRRESILAEFSRDLTDKARQNKLDPVIGREREIDRVIQVLSRRTKNNPVLVGEPGVGKTAIVEGLAMRIVKDQVPRNLCGRRVLTLDLAAVIAGTKYRGEFEERIKRIVKEVSENKSIILFIDELHTIIGAGGAEGAMDAANMLKPALSRGEIQCIGATTTKEYAKHFEKDAALERRFQMVRIDEPSESDTKLILEGLKKQYEEYHGVTYADDVIDAIVKYSHRYITERFLPDKAIDLLDEAGAMKKIASDVRPPELAELENKIEQMTQEKQQLVFSQNYERAAEVRDQVREMKQHLELMRRYWQNCGSNAANLVTGDDVRRVLSAMTGIPQENMDSAESSKLASMEAELHKTVIGQNEAVSLIASAVRRSRAGVSSFKRPLGSFIFLGPTGVGKTLLAKTLAKFLFGTEESLVRIDMSDFMEKHNSSRLVGAPPGYVGYEEGGVLTEKIRRNPYSVVLLDEIEKAHPDVFNLLLQVLEEGELKDNLGHVVNFRNTVIIMTSNAGVRHISAENRLGFSSSTESILSYDEIKNNAMTELKRILSPELLNRIDDTVVFTPLSKEEVANILQIQLGELSERLAEQNLTISLKPSARDYLIENGYDPQFGARPMRRLIQKEIEDPLAQKIIAGETKEKPCIFAEYKNDRMTLVLKKPAKSRNALLTEPK